MAWLLRDLIFSEQGYWTIPQYSFAQGNHTFCPLVQLSSTYPVETSVILSHIPTFQYVRCCFHVFSCILREDKATMFSFLLGPLQGAARILLTFSYFLTMEHRKIQGYLLCDLSCKMEMDDGKGWKMMQKVKKHGTCLKTF